MQSCYRLRLLPPIVALIAIALAGCSGSDGDSGDSAALLAAARTSLDATPSLHFDLTSSNVPTNGTRLESGQGVVARPNSFQGTLGLLMNGSKVSVGLVSTKGTVYAKLPFSDSFAVTDPTAFGLSDPANLIDSKTGITRMFGELTDITTGADKRIGEDVVTQVNGSLPGSLVDDLLTSADPAKPVKAELYITTKTHQLRRAVLTGPFFDKAQDSTFSIVLDQYGVAVTVTAPPTS
jgi:lipoprotein LprG